MAKKKRYNVVMACGAKFRDMHCKFPIDGGEKLVVYSNEDPVAHHATFGDGKYADCTPGCPAKRKGKRKQDRFFTAEDKKEHRVPTGVMVVCMPVANELVK